MKKFFSGNSSAKRSLEGGDGVWPIEPIVGLLRSRFGQVEHIGDEDMFSLYGVEDGEVRFVVAFVTVDGAPDLVTEIGFLARFSGYPMGQSALEAVNRNLHISVATFDNEGDIYLIGGVQAAGVYSDGSLSLVLDAWRRDLMMLIQSLLGGSLAESFPAARFEAARRFADNRAPARSENGEMPPLGDLMKGFMRADGSAKSVCTSCGGRGKIGLIAKACDSCGGTGFVNQRG